MHLAVSWCNLGGGSFLFQFDCTMVSILFFWSKRLQRQVCLCRQIWFSWSLLDMSMGFLAFCSACRELVLRSEVIFSNRDVLLRFR